MELFDIQNVFPASAITIAGSVWLFLRKIAKDNAKAKKEQSAEILHAAKEADALMKAELEAKIEVIEAKLENLTVNINKDIEHLKETYNGEIRNLGQRIEELRLELKNQHGQLVSLLTEMIKKRN